MWLFSTCAIKWTWATWFVRTSSSIDRSKHETIDKVVDRCTALIGDWMHSLLALIHLKTIGICHVVCLENGSMNLPCFPTYMYIFRLHCKYELGVFFLSAMHWKIIKMELAIAITILCILIIFMVLVFFSTNQFLDDLLVLAVQSKIQFNHLDDRAMNATRM